MPRFTTISPTHIEGRKQYAWNNFRDGEYVAIGWLEDIDLSGKSFEEITALVRQRNYKNEKQAIQSFEKFLSLSPGDYVAVNNTNDGLFGVGVIASEYRFGLHMHDIGHVNSSWFYSHYRKVRWLVTTYTPRSMLKTDGEKLWQPYGTVGRIWPDLPTYIARLVAVPSRSVRTAAGLPTPTFLAPVVAAVRSLQQQSTHLERAHESLVEEFFVALGYERHRDIKYRQGRVDISIAAAGKIALIAEVKAAWDLSWHNGREAIKQAYGYAHEQGVRHVLVTNGDTYLLFDRLKGLSWESNLVGQLRLTSLSTKDIELIDCLRPERLGDSTD